MKQSIRTHGRTFTGIVIAAKMQDTATVEWTGKKYIPKYERFLTQRTRVKAHNPKDIAAQKGDIVQISECRPLSKTKHFMIIKKVGREELFEAKEELQEEGKVKQKKAAKKPVEEAKEE